MKYTENMELLLYDANDIMNTNDFVNQNNQKIDAFTAQIKATAEEANAGQKTNASGITEINGKINTINQQLTDGELTTLPQFKTDTDDRLEALEDTVNLTLKPEYEKWNRIISGQSLNGLVDTIIGVYIITEIFDMNNATSNTYPCKQWSNTSVTTSYNYRLDIYKRSGNAFNLPELNTIYINYVPCRNVDISQGSNVYEIAGIGIFYNGVDTVICALSSKLPNTQHRWQFAAAQTLFSKAGPNVTAGN